MELEVLGEEVFGNSAEYLVPGSTTCYDVPQEDVFDASGTMVFTNHLIGVTPVCQFDSSVAAFNVLNSFSFPATFPNGGLGPTLTVLFIISMALYSTCSGSLVVVCK
jgi:hypothetical protein